MKLLVCGGRDYGNILPVKHNRTTPEWFIKDKEYKHIISVLEQFAIENSIFYSSTDNWLPEDIFIISGGATGVDSVAIDWAVTHWCGFKEYPADWGKFGKAAGYLRNKQMLNEGKPDIVIAFPGGKGTANMIKLAKNAGIKIIEVPCLK